MSDSAPSPSAARLGPVLLTVLLDLLGFGLVIPLLTFYAESYGATAVQVTLMMAVYSIAQFLFAPVWGGLSDRVGRRPVMLISIAGSALFLAAFASATSLWQLFLFRALHGACAANISAAQAYVADVTTPENRAKGMGLIGASFGIGFSFGPWMGGELAQFGLTAPIWAAAALSALNLVWAYFGLPESRRPGAPASPSSRRSLDPRALARAMGHPTVGLAVLLTFVATFAFAMMESTFTLVAEHEWSMEAWHVGRMFGLIGVVGIVVQGGLIGRMVRFAGEARLVALGYLLNATGLGILAFTGPGAGIYLGCLFVALGTSMANPALTSLVSRGAGSEEQGAILGANQSLAALARASAPTVGGLLFSRLFPSAAFAAGSVLMLLALAISIPAGRRATLHAGRGPVALG